MLLLQGANGNNNQSMELLLHRGIFPTKFDYLLAVLAVVPCTLAGDSYP